MTEKNPNPSFLQRLLERTGGYYLLVAVLCIQALTMLVVIPSVALIENNASLTGIELIASVRTAFLLTLTSNTVALILILLLSRNAFRRLQAWKQDMTLSLLPNQEKAAWHEITRLPWRYGVLGMASSSLVTTAPLMLYQALALHLTSDQIIYTLLGGVVAALIIVSAGSIGIEWISQPAREVLLPSDFEIQVSNVRAVNIFWKLQVFIIAMVSTGIVILAPLGYRKIVQVVEGLEPAQALREYQLQSIFTVLIVLAIAILFTTLIANLFSAPFSQLVDIFKKVEQGQLSQRARVIATDEAGELEVYFNRMISRLESLQGTLEKQVAERTAQLSAVNEVGRAISAILDPDELIEKLANLITTQFGHYYAAIFLVDVDGKWAELKSATGESGRLLRQAGHRLEVGGQSMVGTAISQKKARIALDVGAEPVRFNNPLLPYTRSEIALPLIAGDRILGALDVQSTKEAAFGQQDIATFQNMANQVAIAIENARLFQETEQQLREIQAAQRQYIGETWKDISQQKRLEYAVGDEVASTKEARLQVPLSLRDKVIGQIELDGEAEWSSEERAWVESVATQAAIALENARLMDESRERAALERAVAEITAKVWSANTIEGILQTAARELGRTLNLTEATIELNTNEEGAAENE